MLADAEARACSDLRVSSLDGAATARTVTLPRLRGVHVRLQTSTVVPMKAVWPSACILPDSLCVALKVCFWYDRSAIQPRLNNPMPTRMYQRLNVTNLGRKFWLASVENTRRLPPAVIRRAERLLLGG